MLRKLILLFAMVSPVLVGCSSAATDRGIIAGVGGAPSGAEPNVGPPAPPEPAASPTPTGVALGGVLGGPIGASLSDDDRRAAWEAQVAALDTGQRRSWRGAHSVYGFVEAGVESGGGCRAYSQTIYVAGRPNRGRGVGCKQSDGSWKMAN
jgi:surface antigen